MKTIKALFEEMTNSEELKKSFAEAVGSGDSDVVAKWIADQGCDASVEEIEAFFEEKADEAAKSGELSPEELSSAAGGTMVTLQFDAGAPLSSVFRFIENDNLFVSNFIAK